MNPYTSISFPVATLLLTQKIKETINIELNRIQDYSEWNQFVLEISAEDLNVDGFVLGQIEQDTLCWKKLAKLSTDLWTDYDYYRYFLIENNSEHTFYNDKLKNLGFVCDTGLWRSVIKPSLANVQTHVFMYCLYRMIAHKMSPNIDNIQHDYNDQQQIIMNKEMRDRNSSANINDRQLSFCDQYNSGDRELCEFCDGVLLVRNSPMNSDIDNDKEIGYNINTTLEKPEQEEEEERKDNDNNKEIGYNYVEKELIDGAYVRIIDNDNKHIVNILKEQKQKQEQEEKKDNDTDTEVERLSPVKDTDCCNRRTNISAAWSCPFCTFINGAGNKYCEVCLSIRELEAPQCDTDDESNARDKSDVDDDDGVTMTQMETWKCRKCRCDNLFDKYACGNCYDYAPFFHKWVCEQCSYFNDPLAPCCDVCDKKNNHLKKCDKCKKNNINVNDNDDRVCGVCRDTTKKEVVLATKDVTQDHREEAWIFAKSRKCKTCNNMIYSIDEIICERCTAKSFYCKNRQCGTINKYSNEHCCKCGLKKGCNVTQYNMVDVYDGSKYRRKWQCTFCGAFNSADKCADCNNMRSVFKY